MDNDLLVDSIHNIKTPLDAKFNLQIPSIRETINILCDHKEIEEMHSIEVFLFIILFWHDATGFMCTEKGGDTGRYPNTLHYQDELERILEAFDRNDIQQMDKMLSSLKDKEPKDSDQQEFSHVDSFSKFVVSL